MKIIHIASEINPFAKTGGLADVVGSLPASISRLGHKVVMFMPLYKQVSEKYSLEFYSDFPLHTSQGIKTVLIKKKVIDKDTTLYFIGEHSYFFRDVIYGDYVDNAERFSFFCRAVLAFIKKEDLSPQVIHCHDWQSALVPLYARQDRYFEKTCFGYTIHNLAYQGVFPYEKIHQISLDPSFFTPDKLEFYGKINFMKAGVIYSDFINTVSPTYRDETLTSKFGWGLEGLLDTRSKDYYGIVNGLDYTEWDPANDPDIFVKYDSLSLRKKEENRKKIMKKSNLLVRPGKALFVAITRLADQKGMDLLVHAVHKIAASGHSFILLGSGEKRYEDMFLHLEKTYKDKVRCYMKYDFAMAHKLYAAGDFFLMPSKFEPCGLSQLISFRYGNIPIVRKTGGLADTVENISENLSSGDGIVFEDYNTKSIDKAIEKAFEVYKSDSFDAIRKRIMLNDFSWERTAKKYISLYERYSNA